MDEVERNISDEVERNIHEMEAMGLLRRTGEFRGGKPVFAITDLGRRLAVEAPEMIELILSQDPSPN